MAGKEDEVMIDQDPTEPLEIEFEEEEGEGNDTVAGGEGEDKAAKADTAPKQEAAKKADESEEEKTLTNREKRHRRNQIRREMKEAREAELAELRAQVAELPKLKQQLAEVQSKSAMTEASAGLQKAQADLQLVESVIAKATEDGDGKRLVEAMRVRDQIGAHIHQLRSVGGGQQPRTDSGQPQTRQPAAAPGLAPAVKTHFDKFATDHPWYQVRGTDQDSLMVRAIDQAVAAEGFDPSTQDYWDELRERVAEKLGNKGAAAVTTTGKPAATTKGGPPVGGGRSQIMPGRQTYTLTPAHLEAIKLAGKDVSDPDVLKHYAKLYQKTDRQNANA